MKINLAFNIRLIIAIVIGLGAYKETGPYTVAFMALVFVGSEISGMLINGLNKKIKLMQQSMKI